MNNKSNASTYIIGFAILILIFIGGTILVSYWAKQEERYTPTVIDEAEMAAMTEVAVVDDTDKSTTVQLPHFPGGSLKMLAFIDKHLIYPEAILNKSEEGVTVRFRVKSDGDIENVTVVEGISPEFDKEAIRIVKLMPKWIPAKRDGSPISDDVTLIITFKSK